MKLKKYCAILFVFSYSLLSAQLDENWEKQFKEVNTDTVDGWKFSGNTSVNFAQSAFVNWAAGESNSYALSELVSLRLAY